MMDAEREQLGMDFHFLDAFVLRRCQIILAHSRNKGAFRIARSLYHDEPPARNTINAVNEGMACLSKDSLCPQTIPYFSPSGRRALVMDWRVFC